MSEVQLIIRFPESLAEIVNKALAKSKENIDIKLNPEESNNKFNLAEPNKASVKFGDKTFPALIARLPCNIETHKTFDHVHYFKAGDIAEMVHVFDSEEDREQVQYEMSQVEGYKRTFLSGITPPTTQIIRRKFLKTRSNKPKPRDVVSAVEEEIQKYTTADDIVEEFEEVVDFEEYMADADHPNGRIYCFDSAALTGEAAIFQNHPELLLQASDKEMMALIEEKEKKRKLASGAPSTNDPLSAEEEEDEDRGGKEGKDDLNETSADGASRAGGEDDEVMEEAVEEAVEDGSGGNGSSSAGSDSDSDDDDFLNELESGVQSDNETN